MIFSEIINNRYRVIKKLGSGTMGDVFLVCDILQNDKFMALKRIKALFFEKKSSLDIIKEEFRIQSQLFHPNLVKVYDLYQDENFGNWFYTMEYIEGKNLKEYLKVDHLNIEEKISIMVSILRAIEYIHSRGIIYRDLKLANIMVNKGNIKLADFGLADEKTMQNTSIKGSISYMAPEIFRGEITFLIDIFAEGILFYKLITNDTFYGDLEIKDVLQILKNEKTYNDYLQKKLENISNIPFRHFIGKMISYNPQGRFDSYTKMIDQLNTIFNKNNEYETLNTARAYLQGANYIIRKKQLEELFKHTVKNNNKDKNFTEVVFVKGMNGSGKKRLFEEFKKKCQLDGIHFYEGEKLGIFDFPYKRFLSILDEIVYDANKNLIAKYGESLKRVLPKNKRLTDFKVKKSKRLGNERKQILNIIADFIIDFSFSSQNAIIIYLNMLESADSIVFSFLLIVLKKIKQFPPPNLKICGSFNDENTFKLNRFITNAEKYTQIIQIQLNSLVKNDIKQFFEAIFGENRVGISLFESFDEITNLVGGNPLYLKELLRILVREKFIVRKEECWELAKPLNELKLTSIIELVGKSIDKRKMSRELKNLLSFFAIIKRELSYEELKDIAKQYLKINEKKLVIFLNKLEEDEILKKNEIVEDTYYSFTRSLYITIFKSKISINQKREIHFFIAEILSKLYKEDLHVYEIAYHYIHGKNKSIEKQIYYIKRAARIYFDNFMFAKSIKLYIALIDLLKEVKYENDEVLATYFLLINVYKSNKNYDKIIQILDGMDKVSQNTKNDNLKAKYYFLYAKELFFSEKYKEALKNIALSLSFIPNSEGLYLSIISLKSKILFHDGNYESAKDILDEALIIAVNKNYIEEECDILMGIGNYYNYLGKFKKAFNVYEKIMHYASNKNSLGIAIKAAGKIAQIYYDKKKYLKSLEAFKLQLELSKQNLNKPYIISSSLGIAKILRQFGVFKKSLFMIKIAYKVAEEIENTVVMATILIEEAYIYNSLNKYRFSNSILDKAGSLAGNDLLVLIEIYYLKAVNFYELYDYENVDKTLNNTFEVIEKINDKKADDIIGKLYFYKVLIYIKSSKIDSEIATISKVANDYLEKTGNYELLLKLKILLLEIKYEKDCNLRYFITEMEKLKANFNFKPYYSLLYYYLFKYSHNYSYYQKSKTIYTELFENYKLLKYKKMLSKLEAEHLKIK